MRSLSSITETRTPTNSPCHRSPRHVLQRTHVHIADRLLRHLLLTGVLHCTDMAVGAQHAVLSATDILATGRAFALTNWQATLSDHVRMAVRTGVPITASKLWIVHEVPVGGLLFVIYTSGVRVLCCSGVEWVCCDDVMWAASSSIQKSCTIQLPCKESRHTHTYRHTDTQTHTHTEAYTVQSDIHAHHTLRYTNTRHRLHTRTHTDRERKERKREKKATRQRTLALIQKIPVFHLGSTAEFVPAKDGLCTPQLIRMHQSPCLLGRRSRFTTISSSNTKQTDRKTGR
jgi:hypothetical protein